MPDLLALNGQIIGGVPLPAKNYVKLWENSDPTVAFGAQTVNLSSDDYDFLFVLCVIPTNRQVSFTAAKGGNIWMSVSQSSGSGAVAYRRLINYVGDKQLSVLDCQATSSSNNAQVVDNTMIVPYQIYGIKKDALATEGGGVGGGHIIEDSEGTDLDQQDILQFKGTLRATNDAQNGKTIIDDSAVEIEWDDWQAMTEAQREAYLEANPKVDILNFPEADADLELELMTKLWENPDPTATFAGQDITLSSDDYDFLMIECRMAVSTDSRMSFIGSKSSSAIFTSFPTSANPGTVQVGVFRRQFTKISDTSFSVADAYKNWYGTSSVDNTLCIPVVIYGFKKKITVTVDAIAENVSTSASKCMLEDGETSVEEKLEEFDSIFDNPSKTIIKCIKDGSVSFNSQGIAEIGTGRNDWKWYTAIFNAKSPTYINYQFPVSCYSNVVGIYNASLVNQTIQATITIIGEIN